MKTLVASPALNAADLLAKAAAVEAYYVEMGRDEMEAELGMSLAQDVMAFLGAGSATT